MWENIEIHVVGLCIDARESGLSALLAEQQTSRHKRIVKIDEKLRQQGAGGLLESLSGLKASALTRSHVADFLVESGVCVNRKKVFKRYLNKGGKAHVPAEWCSMSTAIGAIKGAGGIAILAHPGRYPLNRAKLKRLVDTFRQVGGEALEASYPNIAPEMKQYLEKLGVEFSMYLSCGSDFHDAAATWTDVGKLPALSSEVAAQVVWQHPVWKARVDAI
jgi:predicted metal-dependent phosphoesterase TrpH